MQNITVQARFIGRHASWGGLILALLVCAGVATVAIRAYAPTASPGPAPAGQRQSEVSAANNGVVATAPSRARTDASGTTIAVLPFTGLDENAASIQLVADILTDELINTLARAPQLRVISRQATRQYLGKPVDIATIGTELGARYVLEGTVRFSEQSLRVNVDLVDPATRASVWSARIEPQGHGGGNVQDEIAKRLARELQIELYQGERDEGHPEPGAAALVHKGHESLIASAKGGLETLQRAERYFRQALAQDPTNRAAKRGVAAFHALVGAQLMTPDPSSHLAQAEALLREAIRTDPRIGSAHFFLGLVQEIRRDYAQALESFDRAIEADPSYLSSYAHVGYVLVATGKAREGYERIAYALRTGPRDPNRAQWLRFAGEAKLELGEYDEALKALEKSYELNPKNPLTLRSLAAAYAAGGKLDDARHSLAELRNLAPYLSDAGILERPQTLQGMQPEYARGLALAMAGGPLP
jgi:TolB-like protein/Flp pilus assembly protein TadD